ncbi:helix-turn-helix domain-containing protein [Mucilaginibacter terrenus]|uniref:Helix-turn-helix domain-containing protein n=1 Tax=Mucilaginibacter terrenus TaxID=2482727 RepID=A0A3E2NXR2_9SPHI|nr:helix-turn-helix domain-containing protein [Mucilaginibacter terrenus]RFZ85804.1 helix-turn-helix domain-containing protein [Mucilaginibacter terrenus]
MLISVFVPEYGVIEAITPPFRTFHTANDILIASGKKPVFTVEYVGLSEYVPANNGEYIIKTNRLVKDVTETDLLIIPPAFGDTAQGVKANAEALPYFKKLHDKGCSVASLCLGAFLLAETGLLNGKKCSTHWAHIDEFRKRYPDVEVEDGAIITQHGNIYSSGGASSLWNLILYLVEKFAGREIAVTVSKYFALDIGRAGQSQFAIFKGQKNHGDDDIRKVQDYIEKQYSDKILTGTLADLIHSSRRTFERRFKEATNNTTTEYLQRVRIEASKALFEASRKNVTEIMLEVGYSDVRAFRDTFKKITGLTPIEYKNKFARTAYEV